MRRRTTKTLSLGSTLLLAGLLAACAEGTTDEQTPARATSALTASADDAMAEAGADAETSVERPDGARPAVSDVAPGVGLDGPLVEPLPDVLLERQRALVPAELVQHPEFGRRAAADPDGAVELLQYRTEHSRTLQLADGRIEEVTFTVPIFERRDDQLVSSWPVFDEDGEFAVATPERMVARLPRAFSDAAVVRIDGAGEDGAVLYKTPHVRIQRDGQEHAIQLPTTERVVGAGTVDYTLADGALVYRVESARQGIKSSFRISADWKRALGEADVLRFGQAIELPDGWSVQIDGNEAPEGFSGCQLVTLVDAANRPAYNLYPPAVWAGERSAIEAAQAMLGAEGCGDTVVYEGSLRDGVLVLDVVVDASFLDRPDAEFPVTVDPYESAQTAIPGAGYAGTLWWTPWYSTAANTNGWARSGATDALRGNYHYPWPSSVPADAVPVTYYRTRATNLYFRPDGSGCGNEESSGTGSSSLADFENIYLVNQDNRAPEPAASVRASTDSSYYVATTKWDSPVPAGWTAVCTGAACTASTIAESESNDGTTEADGSYQPDAGDEMVLSGGITTNDVDWFAFDTRTTFPRFQLQVTDTGGTGCDFDAVVKLRLADGTTMFTEDDTGGSACPTFDTGSNQLPQGGFYVTVEGATWQDTGDYELRVTMLDGPGFEGYRTQRIYGRSSNLTDGSGGYLDPRDFTSGFIQEVLQNADRLGPTQDCDSAWFLRWYHSGQCFSTWCPYSRISYVRPVTDVPGNFRLTAFDHNSASWAWDATSKANWFDLGDESGNEVTGFTDMKNFSVVEGPLTENTFYQRAVRGANEAGDGPWSSVIGVTTLIRDPTTADFNFALGTPSDPTDAYKFTLDVRSIPNLTSGVSGIRYRVRTCEGGTGDYGWSDWVQTDDIALPRDSGDPGVVVDMDHHCWEVRVQFRNQNGLTTTESPYKRYRPVDLQPPSDMAVSNRTLSALTYQWTDNSTWESGWRLTQNASQCSSGTTGSPAASSTRPTTGTDSTHTYAKTFTGLPPNQSLTRSAASFIQLGAGSTVYSACVADVTGYTLVQAPGTLSEGSGGPPWSLSSAHEGGLWLESESPGVVEGYVAVPPNNACAGDTGATIVRCATSDCGTFDFADSATYTLISEFSSSASGCDDRGYGNSIVGGGGRFAGRTEGFFTETLAEGEPYGYCMRFQNGDGVATSWNCTYSITTDSTACCYDPSAPDGDGGIVDSSCVGACRDGFENSSGTCMPPTTYASNDLCGDGVDNDCDGDIDDLDADVQVDIGGTWVAEGTACTVDTSGMASPPAGDCDEGTADCVNISGPAGSNQCVLPSSVTGRSDLCDYTNNDCDASLDEDHTSSTDDNCDGVDDDCDGTADDDFVGGGLCLGGKSGCSGTPTGTSLGACESGCRIGTLSCTGGGTSCVADPVLPDGQELCGNGIDEDCDGEIDEGCGAYDVLDDFNDGWLATCRWGTPTSSPKIDWEESPASDDGMLRATANGGTSLTTGSFSTISEFSVGVGPLEVNGVLEANWLEETGGKSSAFPGPSGRIDFGVALKTTASTNAAEMFLRLDSNIDHPNANNREVGVCATDGASGSTLCAWHRLRDVGNDPFEIRIIRDAAPVRYRYEYRYGGLGWQALMTGGTTSSTEVDVELYADAQWWEDNTAWELRWDDFGVNVGTIDSSGLGTEEVCDGRDNDCSGTADDNITFNACTPAFASISSANCSTGIERCGYHEDPSSGSTVYGLYCEATNPLAETCDGLSNDCDGEIDEGVTRTCSTACGWGLEQCTDGSFDSSTCTAAAPDAETCDGLDNDCDGDIDEGAGCECDTTVYAAPEDQILSGVIRGDRRVEGGFSVGAIMDTNGDDVIDNDDVGHIVVVHGDSSSSTGVLAVYEGDGVAGGTTADAVVYEIDDNIDAGAWPIIADVVPDGKPEIIVARGARGFGIYNGADGSTHCTSATGWYNTIGTSLTVGELDPDSEGREIVTPTGVYSADCDLLFTFAGMQLLLDAQPPQRICGTVVADLDEDGTQEIYNGARRFDPPSSGYVPGVAVSPTWTNTSLSTDNYGRCTQPAIVDHDGDQVPSLIVSAQLRSYVLAPDGTTQATFADGLGLGLFVADDIDRDGKMDFVALNTIGNGRLYVYEANSTSSVTLVGSANVNGTGIPFALPTVFDLDGDADREILVSAGQGHFIYSHDLDQLAKELNGWVADPSGIPTVIVADSDADGFAEILIGARSASSTQPVIRQWEAPSGSQFARTAPIYSGSDFRMTNVLDNGFVPEAPTFNWRKPALNSFRRNFQASEGFDETAELVATFNGYGAGADLGFYDGTTIQKCAAFSQLGVDVLNDGPISIPPGITLTVYAGDPDAGGVEIASASTTTTMTVGESRTLVAEWQNTTEFEGVVLYGVVKRSDGVAECDESNNVTTFGPVDLPEPTAEICDNADNDCDQLVDENADGDPLTRSCDPSCGVGNQACTAGTWGACDDITAVPEVCNGHDDDCDGNTDEWPETCGGDPGANCVALEEDDGTIVYECVLVQSEDPGSCFNDPCPTGASCTTSGRCVPYCSVDADCPHDQFCDGTVCVEAAWSTGGEAGAGAGGGGEPRAGCAVSGADAGASPYGALLAVLGVLVAVRRRRR